MPDDLDADVMLKREARIAGVVGDVLKIRAALGGRDEDFAERAVIVNPAVIVTG